MSMKRYIRCSIENEIQRYIDKALMTEGRKKSCYNVEWNVGLEDAMYLIDGYARHSCINFTGPTLVQVDYADKTGIDYVFTYADGRKRYYAYEPEGNYQFLTFKGRVK